MSRRTDLHAERDLLRPRRFPDVAGRLVDHLDERVEVAKTEEVSLLFLVHVAVARHELRQNRLQEVKRPPVAGANPPSDENQLFIRRDSP